MNTVSDARAVVNNPPPTNRGVENVRNSLQSCIFSLDWVRITVWCAKTQIDPFLHILGADVGLEHSGHGGIGFKSVWQGLHGFQLYTDPIDENLVYCSVSLPSKALHNFGLEGFLKAISWLYKTDFRWNVTRCDFAFDTQLFEVKNFVSAYKVGRVQSSVSATQEIKNSDGGHTFYLGSRESLAYLRVYRKADGDSFGDEVFTRVELELKKERADAAFRHLVAFDMEDWAKTAAMWLNGFLQVDRGWWREFVDQMDTAWLKLRRQVSTVATMGRWLRRQVAPTLATYIQATSQGVVDEVVAEVNMLLKEGQRRLTRRHHQLINGNDGDKPVQFAVYAL